MSLALVPTCRNKISTDTVKNLVRLLIEKHYLDLAEKQFLMRLSAQGREELEFHRISIDDGVGTVWRTFANRRVCR
jgi:hypothetical protein